MSALFRMDYSSDSSYGVDDFKDYIHTLMSRKGTNGNLRSNLRSQILKTARSDGYVGADPIQPGFTVNERVAIALIAQFMRNKGMNTAASVFLPACGAKRERDILSPVDLSELLNMESSDEFLIDLIREARKAEEGPAMKSIRTQTDGTTGLSIADRMGMIDEAFSKPRSPQIDSNYLEEIKSAIQEPGWNVGAKYLNLAARLPARLKFFLSAPPDCRPAFCPPDLTGRRLLPRNFGNPQTKKCVNLLKRKDYFVSRKKKGTHG